MELDARLIAKVTAYQPDMQRLAPYRDVPLLVFVGISGAGKNTVKSALFHKQSDGYHDFVTHTTRPPRQNHGVLEEDGVDYHFVGVATAERMLDNHDYIEANLYSNNIYGASIDELEKARQQHYIAVADIDVNGVANFVRLGLNVKPIFILPPSYDIWYQRMIKRYGGVVDKADFQKRIQTAREELQHALETDYFYLVVNDNLDETVELIHAIAHGAPTPHRDPHAETVLRSLLAAFQ